MLLDKDMESIAPELRLEMREIEMAQKLKPQASSQNSIGTAAAAAAEADVAMMAAAEDAGFDATMMAIIA